MIFKNLIIGIIGLIAMNCQDSSELENDQKNDTREGISLNDNEFIYWINSYKVFCTGTSPQMCLQILKSDTIEPDSWQMFYTNINGFDWEPGFIYQIIVRENKIPPNQVPADASDILFTLIKIIDKQKDPVINLHDIWALETIAGKSIEEFNPEERPTLEIKLSMRQIMGTDGCNNYSGKIDQVDRKSLHISALASTRKACRQMELPNLFHTQMEMVHSYTLSNLILTLNDKTGEKLMTFRKVD